MSIGFSKLKVKGFRRLRDAEVRLKGLNVLIILTTIRHCWSWIV